MKVRTPPTQAKKRAPAIIRSTSCRPALAAQRAKAVLTTTLPEIHQQTFSRSDIGSRGRRGTGSGSRGIWQHFGLGFIFQNIQPRNKKYMAQPLAAGWIIGLLLANLPGYEGARKSGQGVV